MSYLFVALGAAFGGVTRYGTAELFKKVFTPGFPYATLFVNILGSFLAAFIVITLSRKNTLSPDILLFLTVGFCGGFTTFSTFSVETITLMQQGNWVTAFLNIALNVFLSIAAAGLALYLSNL